MKLKAQCCDGIHNQTIIESRTQSFHLSLPPLCGFSLFPFPYNPLHVLVCGMVWKQQHLARIRRSCQS